MQYSAAALLTMASAVLADQTPESTVPGFNEAFGVAATGLDIDNIDLRAINGQIFVGGTQSADCIDGSHGAFATFATYSDQTLYLWHTETPVQQVYVDASGMGQGITGYTTGDNPGPKNGSREPFEIDSEGILTFNGVGAKACPTGEDGKWSVWFTSADKPGWQDDCVAVELKAYKTPYRVSCQYN
jgi:hypothetical protein